LSGVNINKTFRIKFEKAGVAKYISHLDLQRVFSRSLTRSGIELMYSEGFNPRPKISFVSAISLGVESLCELADIKIAENLTETQVFEKIKNVFPQGINIREVYEPKTDFKNIDRTKYNIFITADGFAVEDFNKLFEGDIWFEKKPGTTANLKDYICEIAISGEPRENKLIQAVVKTNPELYLNPENIIKIISVKYTIDDYSIQKVEIYDKNNRIFR